MDIATFVDNQLAAWPLAAKNFHDLDKTEIRSLEIDGKSYEVVFNPAREVSSAAKTDTASVAARPCFLCAANRPEAQMGIALDGYTLLVNPFPIYPGHLTIPADAHIPQTILDDDATGHKAVLSMYRIAKMMPDYTVFYNGPKCGASAPDHLHFQAIPSDSLSLENYPFLTFGTEVVSEADAEEFVNHIAGKLAGLPENYGLAEPRMNIFMQSAGDGVSILIIPRRAHRPDCYGRGEGEMLISPGAIDVAGRIVCCRRSDFESLTAHQLETILRQTLYFPD